jgi:putative membrane protein insertion efficiency factor
MKYIFIALVRFYQKCISPLKPSCCRFTPTCSQYAIEAFKERGAIIGFGLTVWRICRCNPACKGGYDPVPLRKKKKASKENKDTEYLSDKSKGRK